MSAPSRLTPRRSSPQPAARHTAWETQFPRSSAPICAAVSPQFPPALRHWRRPGTALGLAGVTVAVVGPATGEGEGEGEGRGEAAGEGLGAGAGAGAGEGAGLGALRVIIVPER